MDKKIFAGAIIVLIALAVFVFSPKVDKEDIKLDPVVLISPKVTPKVMNEIKELKIEDLKEGTGAAVTSGDTIVMHYKGTLLDGSKFDSSYDRGTPFETQIGVGRVIKGWDQGVIGMKVGGKRKLTIPSDLAYGERGVPGAIPPNTPLVFDLELLAIK